MSKFKILYIDSNKEYASVTLSNLIDSNYNVKFAKNIKDALISYSQYKPDLIISDILVDNTSSFDFLKKLKLKDTDLKIIILANESNQEMLFNMIELKIDKLLLKNESFTKLVQEIENINFKKNEQENEQKTQFVNLSEDFYYNTDENSIFKNNEIVMLTKQENSLIQELIKAKGGYISTNQLQDIISTQEIASIDTLRTVIKRIRKKTYQNIIINKSGVGYKINYIHTNDEKLKLDIPKECQLKNKILIVKGDKKKNDSLRFELEKLGFSCENCYTIDDAHILLESEKYDYIISDLNLPDGDSIDFIRDINDSKFIILSTEQDIHYKEYLYFKGIIDYMMDTDDISYLAYNIYKSIVKVETNTKFNNILVIDKSKRICEQIKDLLQPRNYNISILNDLTNAIELVKTKQFSLVILDMNIQDNFEFLHEVKANIDKSISFIMLTDTNRTYDIVREAYKNGAAESLRKPIFAEEFILKVDQIIAHTKLVGELIQQKELIESYKTIVDKSAIVSKTNKNGKITYVNEFFCNISGYSKEELLGQNHNIIRHPDTPDTLFKDLWKTIYVDKKVWYGIVKNRTKDNKSYIVQTSIMPILDSSNNIIEFIALRNDITNIYEANI